MGHHVADPLPAERMARALDRSLSPRRSQGLSGGGSPGYPAGPRIPLGDLPGVVDVRGSPLFHQGARWPFPGPASIHPYCERKKRTRNCYTVADLSYACYRGSVAANDGQRRPGQREGGQAEEGAGTRSPGPFFVPILGGRVPATWGGPRSFGLHVGQARLHGAKLEACKRVIAVTRHEVR